MSSLDTINILGVTLHRYNMQQSISLFDDILGKESKLLVCIANAHTLNTAYVDQSYLSVLGSFLVLNDGIGVSLASRILYHVDVKANLNGTDFLPAYLQSSQRNIRLFLLGGRPGIAVAAANKISQLADNITIVGTHHGYFDESESTAIISTVNDSGANVLLVAFGNPRQEMWIRRYHELLKPNLLIGVGALFDFMSGAAVRAPLWMRRCNMEWVYRLWREPTRLWTRYVIGNPLFIYRVIKQKYRLQGSALNK